MILSLVIELSLLWYLWISFSFLSAYPAFPAYAAILVSSYCECVCEFAYTMCTAESWKCSMNKGKKLKDAKTLNGTAETLYVYDNERPHLHHT